MSFTSIASKSTHYFRLGLATLAMFQFTFGPCFASAATLPTPTPTPTSSDQKTTSPIKHVIVIIGENRSFDLVFATYVPKPGQSVWNLLSEEIINADGTPGRNFSLYKQQAAIDHADDGFLLNPPKDTFPNSDVLPAPLVGGPN